MLSVAIIATIGLVSCKNETKKETTKTEQTTTNQVASIETTFGVRGNCGMCKNTIETAAKSLEGVDMAEWDKLRKEIKVSFNSAKISENDIHKVIAASGYDTDKATGSEDAYNNLPGCCKYDRDMAMSLKGDVKPDTNSNH